MNRYKAMHAANTFRKLARWVMLVALVIVILCLSILIRSVPAQQLSIPSIQSPDDKKATAKQDSIEVRAAKGEAPLSRLYKQIKVEASKIHRLPALDPREKVPTEKSKQVQIGVVRSLGRQLDAKVDGSAYAVPEGNILIMRIASEGARLLRVHLTEVDLPPGDRIFVYSMKNPDEIYGPYNGLGPSDLGNFWTPPVEGDEIAVEYFTARSISQLESAPFRVSHVSHIFKDVSTNSAAGACENEVPPEWAQIAKSVGALSFVFQGQAELFCTGTLLNDPANDFTPYLMTANHCGVNTQEAAQSLRVYWFYDTGDSPPADTPFTDGADFLKAGCQADYSLLRLTGSLPGGLVFSGWDATPTQLGIPVTGIHHPAGSHKRISFGVTTALDSDQFFQGVSWNSGVTEGGSSGSGLWEGSPSDARLVGELQGGASDCSNPTGLDDYGRFSVIYPDIASCLSGMCSPTPSATCIPTPTPCSFSINPTCQSFPGGSLESGGGSGTVNVTAPNGCSWTTVNNIPWVTITSGASGSGNGTVSYSVARNTGPARSATMTIAGQMFTIMQNSGYTFTQVASLGDSAPGGGTFLNDFEVGGVNARGDVAFVSDVTEGEGLFVASRRGNVRQVVRGGMMVGSVRLGPFALDLVGINDAGDVGFCWLVGPLDDPIGINGGLFRANANGVTKPIVLPGITPAPGGGLFVGCLGSTISNGGDIAFIGLVQQVGGPIERGVFVARANGPIVRIAGPGDPAPGGGVFSSFAARPSIAPNGGEVAFMARVGTESEFGIYVNRGSGGRLDAIARPGSPAPRGGVFGSCFSPVLNNRGDIAFASQVPSRAIFLNSRGQTTAVVMPSDPLPGNHFVDSVGSHYLNDRGEVAFDVTRVPFAGPCDLFGVSGLYVSADGEVRLVANTGLLISGVGTLDDVSFSQAKMNDRGEILFQATLADGRVVLLVAMPIEEL